MNHLLVDNPTREDRHAMLLEALRLYDRVEDYKNIIELNKPPIDILKLAQGMTGKGIKVGVLGAGCAGLSAAFELSKVGFDITIIEGSQRIGGRIYTHYFEDGFYSELGAMRIPVSHETVWHYINQFNLNTHPFLISTENSIVYAKDVRIIGEENDELIMKYLYPKFALTEQERSTPISVIFNHIYNYYLKKMSPEMKRYLFIPLPEYPQAINEMDNITFRRACEYLGLSPACIDMITCIIGIDRGVFYNNYIEAIREIYSANFSFVYEIEGGLFNLPKAFYDRLIKKPNVKFKMQSVITGIIYDDESHNVKIRYVKDHQELFESYDYIICTLPFSTLRNIEICPLFTNSKMQAIREVNYTNSQKTGFFCNERFWEREINGERILGGGSVTDLSITNIWYPSRPKNIGKGTIIASYNLGLDANRIGNLNKDYQEFIIKHQLEQVHGLPHGYLDKVVIDSKSVNWDNEDLFLGAFCVFNTEQHRLFSYAMVQPEYFNQVFFAGEHISSHHAWVQGALQTGMIAANQLVKSVKSKSF